MKSASRDCNAVFGRMAAPQRIEKNRHDILAKERRDGLMGVR
jgi:hypothetical protein